MPQHLDSMLSALTHHRTKDSIAIRRNVLLPLPALLHKCGSSLRNSLDQVTPHLAERLVDNDMGVRTLAARALFELLTVVRASLVVSSLLSRAVIGRSVRVREAVLLLLAHAVRQRKPPPGEELPAACLKELPTLLKHLDDPTTLPAQATLSLLQEVQATNIASFRSQLAAAATSVGIPRGAVRAVNGRLEEVERGTAPYLPPLHVAYPPPPPLPTPLAPSLSSVSTVATPGLQPSHAVATPTHAGSSAYGGGGRTGGCSERHLPTPHSSASVAAELQHAAGQHHAASHQPPMSAAHHPFHPHATPQTTHGPPTSPHAAYTHASPLPTHAAAPSNAPAAPTHAFPPLHASEASHGGPPSTASSRPERGERPERRSLAATDDEFLSAPSPVRLGGPEEAARELKDIARELRQPLRQDGVWQERAAAMRRLHGLLLGGAGRLPTFAHLFHVHMVEPLALQLKDLRSKCVKLACAVIIEAARTLGPTFRESAVDLMPTLVRVLRVTVSVITEAADGCIQQLLQHVRSSMLLPPIIAGVSTKDCAPLLRCRCSQYVETVLRTFSAANVEDELAAIESSLTKALADAAADVRTAARAAFVALEARWPLRAAQLKERLPPSTSRLLLASPSKGGGREARGGGEQPSSSAATAGSRAAGGGGAAPAAESRLSSANAGGRREGAARERVAQTPATSMPSARTKPAAPRGDRPWLADRRKSLGVGRSAPSSSFEVEIFEGPKAVEGPTTGTADRRPPWDDDFTQARLGEEDASVMASAMDERPLPAANGHVEERRAAPMATEEAAEADWDEGGEEEAWEAGYDDDEAQRAPPRAMPSSAKPPSGDEAHAQRHAEQAMAEARARMEEDEAEARAAWIEEPAEREPAGLEEEEEEAVDDELTEAEAAELAELEAEAEAEAAARAALAAGGAAREAWAEDCSEGAALEAEEAEEEETFNAPRPPAQARESLDDSASGLGGLESESELWLQAELPWHAPPPSEGRGGGVRGRGVGATARGGSVSSGRGGRGGPRSQP